MPGTSPALVQYSHSCIGFTFEEPGTTIILKNLIPTLTPTPWALIASLAWEYNIVQHYNISTILCMQNTTILVLFYLYKTNQAKKHTSELAQAAQVTY